MSGERSGQGSRAPASVPARVHSVEMRVTQLERKVRSLSDGDSSLGDGDLMGKKVRLCVDGEADEAIEGEVIGVSKYTIRIKISVPTPGKVRTYRKGYIRWHEEL